MENLAHTPNGAQAPVSKTRNYQNAFRLCDDINARQAAAIAASLGGDAARILEAGYGLSTVSFARALQRSEPMKYGTIVLPCRDASSAIVGLHDDRLQWLTAPAVHIANVLRARFAEIEICDTTAQADSVALAENICAVGRNGCDDRMVEAAILSALRLGKADKANTRKRAETVRLARAA